MFPVSRKYISAVVLLCLVLATLAVPAIHAHGYAGGTGGPTEIRSHDCGPGERHPAAGDDRDCPVCHRAFQFIPASCTPGTLTTVASVSMTPCAAHPSIADHRGSLFFRRGPPALS